MDEDKLPEEYIRYVESGGPMHGFTDLFGGYFELESLNGIAEFNRVIETAKYAPGFTAFAGNGGGEFYAFDESHCIYVIPLIGMSEADAIKVADSWSDFLTHVKSES